MIKLLCLCVLVLGYAASVVAQISSIPDSVSQTGLGGINSINGTVFDPAGRPLQTPMRIRLSTMARGDRNALTSDNGSFAFTGLPAGNYTIIIDKEKDYEPFSQTVDIIQFRGSPAVRQTVNIRLKFKPGTDAKPGVINAELANVPQNARIAYEKALELGAKREYRAAIEQLKTSVNEDPTFAVAFNELGVQYLRINQLENADDAFQQALKINPDAVPALINRGIANFMMKRHGEAVPILRKALAKDDKSAVGHYFLGQALANLGLFKEAEKELSVSLEIGKDVMKEALRMLAVIFHAQGEKVRAAEQLEKYLVMNPTANDAEQLRASIKQWRETSPSGATPSAKPGN